MSTIKFYTLGCKVNQYETQSIREQFAQAGFKELEDGSPADTYVVNTCTVTHRADSESLNLIRRAKRENPKAKIIVTGCLAELDRDRISQINKKIIIVTNKEKENIVEKVIARHKVPKQSQNKRLLRSCFGFASQSLAMTKNTGISYFKGHTRAFLKIQDGCDNFCSYCKVPLARGRSTSRSLFEIVKEAKNLVRNGFKEIVLCGICLGSYGKDLKSSLRGEAEAIPKTGLLHNDGNLGSNDLKLKISIIDVINRLEKINGLLRIRLSSIEAGDISAGLINEMAKSTKLCRHLHIPIQSGDDEILKKMNRRYSSKDYLNLIRKIKKNVPALAITTDVLVGFPGETEENFQNTVKLVKAVLPLRTHIFPYSPRPGTAAFNLKDKISPLEIRQRINFLRKISDDCALKYRRQFLGRDMVVLIEGQAKENSGFWEGYTGNYIKVLVKSGLDLRNKSIALKLKKIDKECVLTADYFC